jgi:hypothetical protein
MARRIKVRGVPQEELTPDAISHLIWMMAKAEVERKRARERDERESKSPRKAVSS